MQPLILKNFCVTVDGPCNVPQYDFQNLIGHKKIDNWQFPIFISVFEN